MNRYLLLMGLAVIVPMACGGAGDRQLGDNTGLLCTPSVECLDGSTLGCFVEDDRQVVVQTCEYGCDEKLRGCRLCEPSKVRCADEDTLATCSQNGFAEIDNRCVFGCDAQEARCRKCEPNVKGCSDDDTLVTCSADGMTLFEEDCEEFGCNRISGQSCLVCEPNTSWCKDGKKQSCTAGGAGTKSELCITSCVEISVDEATCVN